MKNQREIYSVLKEWVEVSKEKSLDKFNKSRFKFGQLEPKTFGSIHEMVNNPLAMKYDKIRNFLVKYSRCWEKKYLDSASNLFSELLIP